MDLVTNLYSMKKDVDIMIESFDSTEELFARIEEARRTADDFTSDWQKAAAPGSKFMQFIPEMDLIVYGKVLDPIQSEIDAGADEDELEYQRHLRSRPHMANYRFCRCYSVLCPEGEYGDVHVSTIAKFVTDNQFEALCAAGWPADAAIAAVVIESTP